MTKLAVLDIENTIVVGYSENEYTHEGRLKPQIDASLEQRLKQLDDMGYTIVTVGVAAEDIAYYYNQFLELGIGKYIDAYSPQGAKADDSLDVKLKKYAEQYNVTGNYLFYYDDIFENVQNATKAGFKNSFQVRAEAPLSEQLEQLIQSPQTPRERSTPLEVPRRPVKAPRKSTFNVEQPIVLKLNDSDNDVSYSFCMKCMTGVALVGGISLLIAAAILSNIAMAITGAVIIGAAITFSVFKVKDQQKEAQKVPELGLNYATQTL